MEKGIIEECRGCVGAAGPNVEGLCSPTCKGVPAYEADEIWRENLHERPGFLSDGSKTIDQDVALLARSGGFDLYILRRRMPVSSTATICTCLV